MYSRKPLLTDLRSAASAVTSSLHISPFATSLQRPYLIASTISPNYSLDGSISLLDKFQHRSSYKLRQQAASHNLKGFVHKNAQPKFIPLNNLASFFIAPPPIFRSVCHLPQKPSLAVATGKTLPTTTSLTIKVSDSRDGAVPGVLHIPHNHDQATQSSAQAGTKTAAILLSGASGGLVGPSSIYLGMATKLASLNQGIPVLRLDYRYPARNQYCVADVLAAMSHLEREHAISRFVLVGWSFGGAPVFTVAGNDKRVVGCATVASQTAGTDGIERLALRPVLLLHGLRDQTLGSWCSESLYRRYGEEGTRELKLFEGDDHALTRNAREAEEMLCRFVMKCADIEEREEESEVVKEKVVDERDRVALMEKAGHLAGEERVE
ncbi:MAG: hypothetical protein L6R38_001414 [Xanthoria sp. 2 TBL-2021]|nr:MAG: hypothetical protein L6R38_001414 [Xanthoria sp. 2 TBL-2021]